MYAAVTTVALKPNKLDEAIRTYREQVIPLFRDIPGFQSLRLLVDRSTNTMTVVSIYDTEANAGAVPSRDVWQKALTAMHPLMEGSPNRRVSEVVLEV